MKEKFAVSLMCMDFLKVGEQLNILNDWVGMYHVDIMDGHYCKNITLSPDLVKSFKKVSKLPLDVHLMTTNPEDWIDPVAEAGADIISLHAETINGQTFRLYNRIEELGLKAGLVLNPATPLSEAAHYLNRIDPRDNLFAVIESRGERIFRNQSVVHGNDSSFGLFCQKLALILKNLSTSPEEASAVEENHRFLHLPIW